MSSGPSVPQVTVLWLDVLTQDAPSAPKPKSKTEKSNTKQEAESSVLTVGLQEEWAEPDTEIRRTQKSGQELSNLGRKVPWNGARHCGGADSSNLMQSNFQEETKSKSIWRLD